MTTIRVKIEHHHQPVPCELTVTLPEDYDASETLMLAATQAGLQRIPWFTGNEVFTDDGTIDEAACLRILMQSAFGQTKDVTLTVEHKEGGPT